MTEQSPGDGEAVAHLSDGTHHRGVFGLDGLAISASTLCLIHCLFLPIAIAFLPSLADWADWGETIHIVMLAIAVPLSGGTLLGGWRRHRAMARCRRQPPSSVPPLSGTAIASMTM